MYVHKQAEIKYSLWSVGSGDRIRWGESFRTRPDCHWGSPSLLLLQCLPNFFPGGKAVGGGVENRTSRAVPYSLLGPS